MSEDNETTTENISVSGQTQPGATAAPNPLAIPVAIVIAGVLIALAIIFSGQSNAPVGSTDNTPTVEEPSNEELLALAAMQEDDHVRGNRNAPVYILEFSDTECPFCKRFHDTMKQVMIEYDGEVAWVYRHFPLAQLHPTAPRESEALECANEIGGPDAFWAYTDAIYDQTPQGAALPDEQLPEIARALGISVGRFTECLNSGKYAEEVQKDVDNAVALGGRGTPHSLVVAGDQLIPINGAQPIEVIRTLLDTALEN